MYANVCGEYIHRLSFLRDRSADHAGPIDFKVSFFTFLNIILVDSCLHMGLNLMDRLRV